MCVNYLSKFASPLGNLIFVPASSKALLPIQNVLDLTNPIMELRQRIQLLLIFLHLSGFPSCYLRPWTPKSSTHLQSVTVSLWPYKIGSFVANVLFSFCENSDVICRLYENKDGISCVLHTFCKIYLRYNIYHSITHTVFLRWQRFIFIVLETLDRPNWITWTL
jgi:hypothetical protein